MYILRSMCQNEVMADHSVLDLLLLLGRLYLIFFVVLFYPFIQTFPGGGAAVNTGAPSQVGLMAIFIV